MSTVSWPVGNDQTLDFTSYNLNATWNNVAGLYIFAYDDGKHWRALYVGQTNDFSSRIPNHERIGEAVRKGVSHVHAMVVTQAATRDTLEKLLIQHLQPPMNNMLK